MGLSKQGSLKGVREGFYIMGPMRDSIGVLGFRAYPEDHGTS